VKSSYPISLSLIGLVFFLSNGSVPKIQNKSVPISGIAQMANNQPILVSLSLLDDTTIWKLTNILVMKINNINKIKYKYPMWVILK
jgi:hypothetical protein